MEFSASITRACALQTIRTTYDVRTNVPTPPALCLGTPVPRQKSGLIQPNLATSISSFPHQWRISLAKHSLSDNIH